jgi:hypothetical protein
MTASRIQAARQEDKMVKRISCLVFLIGVLATSAFSQTTHLYADSDPNGSCARGLAGSSAWTLQNVYRDHSVVVVLNRFFTQGVNTSYDHPVFTLAPGQNISLGCSTWIGGRQSFSVQRVTWK